MINKLLVGFTDPYNQTIYILKAYAIQNSTRNTNTKTNTMTKTKTKTKTHTKIEEKMKMRRRNLDKE